MAVLERWVGHDADLGGRTPFGIELSIGAAVMVTGVVLAGVLFAPNESAARLSVVAVVAGGWAAVARDSRASLLAAGVGYLLFDGFLLNEQGTLSWATTCAVWQVGVLVLAVGTGRGLAWVRRARERSAVDAELLQMANDGDEQAVP